MDISKIRGASFCFFSFPRMGGQWEIHTLKDSYKTEILIG